MANTKNALLRTMVIDRCLSNESRHFSTKDLMNECNKALSAQGMAEVTSLNTIREDIDAIKGQWKVDVKVTVSGRNRYYSYARSGFSIYHNQVPADQKKKFELAMSILEELRTELFCT